MKIRDLAEVGDVFVHWLVDGVGVVYVMLNKEDPPIVHITVDHRGSTISVIHSCWLSRKHWRAAGYEML